jgi:hypothetical protein
MMLIDNMQFSDQKTGAWVRVEVVNGGKARILLYDGQNLHLTIDQIRAIHAALGRVLEGR